jgi:hypothetical protein
MLFFWHFIFLYLLIVATGLRTIQFLFNYHYALTGDKERHLGSPQYIITTLLTIENGREEAVPNAQQLGGRAQDEARRDR